jgi:hypothetical protein
LSASTSSDTDFTFTNYPDYAAHAFLQPVLLMTLLRSISATRQ